MLPSYRNQSLALQSKSLYEANIGIYWVKEWFCFSMPSDDGDGEFILWNFWPTLSHISGSDDYKT